MGVQRKLKSKTSSIFTADDNSHAWHKDQPSIIKSKSLKWMLIVPLTCFLSLIFYYTTKRDFDTGLTNDAEDKKWIFPITSDISVQIDNQINQPSNWKPNKRIGKRSSYQTISSEADQRKFLQKYGNMCYSSKNPEKPNSLLDRFNELHSHSKQTSTSIATTIWKYCVLYIRGGGFIDEDTVPLASLEDILSQFQIDSTIKSVSEDQSSKNQDIGKNEPQNYQNIAVLKDESHIHDGFIFFGSTRSDVAKKILSYLVNASDNIIHVEPQFVAKRLYSIIKNEIALISRPGGDFNAMKNDKLQLGLNGKRWNLLELKCRSIQPNQIQDLKNKRILTRKGR